MAPKQGKGVRNFDLEKIRGQVLDDLQSLGTIDWAFVIIGRAADKHDARGGLAYGSFGDSPLGAACAAVLLDRQIIVAGNSIDVYAPPPPDDDEDDDE